MHSFVARVVVASTVLLLAAPAARAAPGQPIEIWTRAAGRHDASPPPARVRIVTLDLDRLPLVEAERADLQYDGATLRYRQILVEELIRRYEPPAAVDVALLHFDNGMIVPLRFRDRALLERLRPAIARAVRVDGRWTSDFPEVRRNVIGFAEARPLRFFGNKLVVSEPWHPDLVAGTESSFTPFRHTDSLAGIELVAGDAYGAQFDVAPEARAGLAVYQHVCAFCHGARNVGAQFGWDFVEPIPVSDYRKKDLSMYYHLRYRATNAPSRGLMMPSLPFVSEKDAADVLAWLRAVAARPLNAYAPR